MLKIQNTKYTDLNAQDTKYKDPIDQCIPNADGDLLYSDCDNTDAVNELITDYFSAPNCTDDSSIFNTSTQGGSDASKNVIPVQNQHVIMQNDGFILYPINACHTTKSTTDSIVTYSAFKYTCDAAGDVYKYEYDTGDYCKGTPISTTNRVNAELSHYECNLNDCQFADLCELSLFYCEIRIQSDILDVFNNTLNRNRNEYISDASLDYLLIEWTYYKNTKHISTFYLYNNNKNQLIGGYKYNKSVMIISVYNGTCREEWIYNTITKQRDLTKPFGEIDCNYNPRSRPWYNQLIHIGGVNNSVWTKPYWFQEGMSQYIFFICYLQI